MSIIIRAKKSKNGQRTSYYFEWGKAPGRRVSSGYFTYNKPKDQLQKNHNKETQSIIENKHAQLTLEYQAGGTSYVPVHKLKGNFLDFYDEFVKKNSAYGNRHLQSSYKTFKKFMGKDFVMASKIDEVTCEEFRIIY